MRRPTIIARQSGHPTGWLGALIARIMARETTFENQHSLNLLDLQRQDRLIDIGTGHGATLKTATKAIDDGLIVGVDPSAVMVRLARRKNRCSIKRGLVEVHCAQASSIPFPDAHFTKLMTVHTIYFWPDLAHQLVEIHRLAASGARFVMCFRPQEDPTFAGKFPDSIYHIRPKDLVLDAIEDAGFTLTSVEDEETERGRLIWAAAENRAH